MKHCGNISKIKITPDMCVDVVIGGSPCQDLSIAGSQRGLSGERSGLFMEQIRIIREMRETSERTGRTDIDVQCRYAVWENVPGALSSNNGEDFRTVLQEFCRIKDANAVIPKPKGGKWANAGTIMGDGYSVAWRVMDAQFWGVPQRRRRIALVADFAGQTAAEVLFKRKGLSRHYQQSKQEKKAAAGDAENCFDGCG